MVTIRMAQADDADSYCEHSLRHRLESGTGGDPIFHPSAPGIGESPEKTAHILRESWAKETTQAGWSRAWLLTEADAVVGSLKLVHSPPMSSTLHRATLMMGIERSHRGKGHGSALIRSALEWAREQPALDWLQLFVFAHNEKALALYRKFGFRENGCASDMFRVNGEKITDISMELPLR